MPSVRNAGCSAYTAVKQDHFGVSMRVHSTIIRGILRSHPEWTEPYYYYIDMTAGSGSEDGFDGSPLIAMRTLAEAGVRTRAFFLEKDANKLSELRRRLTALLSLYPDFHCEHEFIPGDHAETFVPLLRSIRHSLPDRGRKIYGLVYSDPYGVPPFDTLRAISYGDCFERLDILTYLSATACKRVLKSSIHPESRSIADHLRSLRKRTIHVRNQVSAHQWSFAFCTNATNYPMLRGNGFWSIDSEQGRRILMELSMTNEELKAAGIKKRPRQHQGNLFS
jgi:three-Cys-motif partner protein